MKSFLLGVLILAKFIFAQDSSSVHFMPAGDFFYTSVSVTVAPLPAGLPVYYTTDGAIPDSTSTLYSNTLIFEKTTVLRACIYPAGQTNPEIFTKTYFIDEQTTLPIITLSSDHDNFFSDSSGIYVEGKNGTTGYCSTTPRNWNQDWERPVHVEYFEADKQPGFTIDAGIKIGGGCTRLYDEKSLALYFRSEYGAKKLHYKVFKDLNITEFNNLSLRNGGQDWYRALIRDGMMQLTVKDHMDLGIQAFQPVIVFINGTYWGIYNIREKHNEHFIASHYSLDPDSINIFSNNMAVKQGSADTYAQMITFISENDMTDTKNYAWVKTQMDVDQYIDYLIAEIFFANIDWPGGNVTCWQAMKENAKWHWLIYDLDLGFGAHGLGQYDSNSLENASSPTETYYANPPWSTFLFRKLLENEDFKNTFIQRYSIHMSTTFKKERMLHLIDSLQTLIVPEVPRHLRRWPKSLSLGRNWQQHIDIMTEFANLREQYARGDLQEKFNLGRTTQLNVKTWPPNGGKIYVETVRIDADSLGIPVYRFIPIHVRAKANTGYRFSSWSGVSESTSDSISFTLESTAKLTGRFEVANGASSDVVINEINYNSAPDFDPEDWVEFYNNTNDSVDMSNWYFSDSDASHKFIFPSETVIFPNSFLVLCRDTTAFKSLYPAVENYLGIMDFGLSSGGELVRLFDNNGLIIDSLTFNDKSPWPTEADGDGATLALVNPDADNSQPTNWAASLNHGTPGMRNDDVLVGISPFKNQEQPTVFAIFQNYPNPFNPSTVICYQLPIASEVKLTVYDVLGREIEILVDKKQSAGTYRVTFNGEMLANGFYFYRLQTGEFSDTKRMLLIK